MSNELKKIVSVIMSGKDFMLSTHINPDGDGLGAEIALGLALRKMRKKVVVLNQDPVPENYKFLLPAGFMNKTAYDKRREYIGISLECSDKDRLGDIQEKFFKSETIINIDHHPVNKMFGSLNYIRPSACAVGEQIYDLINELGVKFDKYIASAIYTSILTDTGSFAYSNTSKRTHEIAIEMMKYGVDTSEVYRQVYEVNSLKKLALLGMALSSMEVNKNGRLAWVTLSNDVFVKTGASYEDAEGIINYPRSIKGVEIAVSFAELKNNKTKVSFRSKSKNIDVNKIASLFGGGGHSRAAGALISGDLHSVVKEVLLIIEKKLNNLH
jgi:phosphoesterase RecJ-like protein